MMPIDSSRQVQSLNAIGLVQNNKMLLSESRDLVGFYCFNLGLTGSGHMSLASSRVEL